MKHIHATIKTAAMKQNFTIIPPLQPIEMALQFIISYYNWQSIRMFESLKKPIWPSHFHLDDEKQINQQKVTLPDAQFAI